MRGTICYIMSYIATNRELREEITELDWEFFFNTNIVHPTNKNLLHLNLSQGQVEEQVFNDLEKINKYIILSQVLINYNLKG